MCPQSVIPQLIDAVNHEINKKLRFGYDVGKGFVMGEEEVSGFLDSMIDNNQICREVKNKMTEIRLEIIKELGNMNIFHFLLLIFPYISFLLILINVGAAIVLWKHDGLQINNKVSDPACGVSCLKKFTPIFYPFYLCNPIKQNPDLKHFLFIKLF